MFNRIIKNLLAVALAFGLISCGSGKSEKTSVAQKFITIGTGGMTGVYYPTGGAIAKILNDNFDTYHIKATVQSTGGSVFNINSILAGDMEFGIAQSDVQYQAYMGTGEWEGRPQPELRSLLSLHSETITLIASDPSGINIPADMKGKRVAIGNPGSGMRRNALDALELAGLTIDDIHAEDLQPVECAGMLQDGRIDAYFYTVGHPNGSIKEAVAGTTPVHFVPFTDLGNMLAEKPYYTKVMIDISPYPGLSNKENLPSFGVKATIVASSKMSDETAYSFVKAICDKFDSFTTLHPALNGLKKEDILTGMTAPIHPGALKYYKETGLIQ